MDYFKESIDQINEVERGNPYKGYDGKKVRLTFDYFFNSKCGETIEGILECKDYRNTVFVGHRSIGTSLVRKVEVI